MAGLLGYGTVQRRRRSDEMMSVEIRFYLEVTQGGLSLVHFLTPIRGYWRYTERRGLVYRASG